jgi:hypothetical protein
LGISKTLLYELIATGALKTPKLGKWRLVLKIDLDAFLRGVGGGEGDAVRVAKAKIAKTLVKGDPSLIAPEKREALLDIA